MQTVRVMFVICQVMLGRLVTSQELNRIAGVDETCNYVKVGYVYSNEDVFYFCFSFCAGLDEFLLLIRVNYIL